MSDRALFASCLLLAASLVGCGFEPRRTDPPKAPLGAQAAPPVFMVKDIPPGVFLGFKSAQNPDPKKWGGGGSGYPVEIAPTMWTGGCDIPPGAFFVQKLTNAPGKDWDRVKERWDFFKTSQGTMLVGAVFAMRAGELPDKEWQAEPVDDADVPMLHWFERLDMSAKPAEAEGN
jgi:hypothetical protein